MVMEQVRAGRRLAEVAAGLDLCQGTVFRWVRQERIDRGELAGTPAAESAALGRPSDRIAELESEPAPLTGERVVRPGAGGAPKDLCSSPATGPISCG